jgi:predicted glycosyltransferase
MPLNAIKRWSYFSALKKHLNKPSGMLSGSVSTNPARSFLILFNGTDPKNVDFFKALHSKFEKTGIKVKMLAFAQTKEDSLDFGMAMYNENNIKWNLLPEQKLTELVRNKSFDILFHINPEQLTHLHFLGVAAKADFKISTLSDLPNDFNLTVKTGKSLGLPEIFQHMKDCLDKLSI